MALNKVMIHGRLTRDPEVRYTQEGSSIARFSVAVDRYNSKTKEHEADFINCVAFGKTAENCEKYYTKGKETIITGSIKTGSYTNNDGNKVYTTDIWVEQMEFCGSKDDSANNAAPETAKKDDFINLADGLADEVPFN